MLCYFRDNTSSSGGIFLMMPYMLAPREWLVAKNQETEEAVGYPKGHPDSWTWCFNVASLASLA